ncbi:MAG: preprotein translocase subunit SecA, partial [Bacilli bacterium]|nr:preprotein translocase subunit SecA [Bacilli bacterium]
GIKHETLNAKNHEREAHIVAQAGRVGAVTIATNMAGRGTDIKLGEGVKELGGLCVFGTERHESRRIDNQLRGRSGRQGDPGFSRFYVSFDDELMRRFAPENLRNLFVNQLQDEALESRNLVNAVTNAQKQIEGQNFDIRKNLLDYDDVLAKQRQIIYNKRDSILFADDISEMIHGFFLDTGKFLCKKSVAPGRDEGLISGETLKRMVEPAFMPEGTLPVSAYDEAPLEEAGEDLGESLYGLFLKKRATWPQEQANQAERQISLSVIDHNWTKHIDTMEHLREGISLRSYAHTNPLQDYVNEGYDLFREMNERIAVDAVYNFLNVKIERRTPPPAPTKDGAVEVSAENKAENPNPEQQPKKEEAAADAKTEPQQ